MQIGIAGSAFDLKTLRGKGLIMHKRWFSIVVTALQLIASATVTAAENDGYILLAMTRPPGMASYELIFENVDTNQIVRIIDPAASSRFTFRGSPYLLKEVPSGRYFLSAINHVHDSDIQRIAELRDVSEYIHVSKQAIIYIGSLSVKVQSLQGNANTVEIEYEPTSEVLRAAVAEQTELFRSHQVYVAVPGAEPVLIERSLLGF